MMNMYICLSWLKSLHDFLECCYLPERYWSIQVSIRERIENVVMIAAPMFFLTLLSSTLAGLTNTREYDRVQKRPVRMYEAKRCWCKITLTHRSCLQNRNQEFWNWYIAKLEVCKFCMKLRSIDLIQFVIHIKYYVKDFVYTTHIYQYWFHRFKKNLLNFYSLECL